MELYPYALFLHIVGVLALFIAIGLEWASLFRMRAAKTTAQVREWVRVVSALDPVFPLAALIILGAGLYMTFTAWGWGQGWIDVSLVTLVAISLLAPIVNGPRVKAIHAGVEAAGDGPVPADLYKLTHNPVLRTFMQTTGFAALGIVCLMTTKPGWIGAVVVMVVAMAIGFILAQVSPRGLRTTQLAEAPTAMSQATAEEASVR